MKALSSQSINTMRFLDRFEALSSIGAIDCGGVNRQALSAADIESHRLVARWFDKPGYSTRIDAIGNVFVTRHGRRMNVAPVMMGSHLDSQPNGGRFDGALGVLAAAEVLAGLDDEEVLTRRPVELVIWMNEEGCRFSPVTMGSSVHSGRLAFDEAIAAVDPSGVSFGEALAEFSQHLALMPAATSSAPHAYVELHIEQGPVLEAESCDIGVVTGVQGLCQYQVDVRGQEAHAGTTPSSMRQDAFVAARQIIGRLDLLFQDPEDLTRFTVGRCDIQPSVPNTVPSAVSFSIDLRHPDGMVLECHDATIRAVCAELAAPCQAAATPLIAIDPVVFDAGLIARIERTAAGTGLRTRRLLSGATHDAANMARMCPAGMIFIPCRKGVSHRPDEFATLSDMIGGADVLNRVVRSLAL